MMSKIPKIKLKIQQNILSHSQKKKKKKNFSEWSNACMRCWSLDLRFFFFLNIFLYSMLSRIRNMVLWDKIVEHNEKKCSENGQILQNLRQCCNL